MRLQLEQLRQRLTMAAALGTVTDERRLSDVEHALAEFDADLGPPRLNPSELHGQRPITRPRA